MSNDAGGPKQIRKCLACGKETEYDAFAVDGYGFTKTICACGAVSDYRGVIGTAKTLPDGTTRVTWTKEYLAEAREEGDVPGPNFGFG